jgi:hypothetical protein
LFIHRWYPEYVQLTDQKTGEINCFIVEQYLYVKLNLRLFINLLINRNEKYGGLKDDHLILNKQPNNQLCDQLQKEEMIESYDQTRQRSRPNSELQERFQVEIKTGRSTCIFSFIRFSI